jgi:regulator of replication initiation timing
MAMNENINNSVIMVSEITTSLNNSVAMILKEVQKLQDEVQKLCCEKEKLVSEIEKLRGEQTQLTVNVSPKKHPAAIINTAEKTPDNTPSMPAALADQFKAPTSINDSIAKPDIPLLSSPVSDIAKAIGLNDRLMFIRELFNGDDALFAQTVKQLNAIDNLKDATAYIQTVAAHWRSDSEAVRLFLSILKRRYL